MRKTICLIAVLFVLAAAAVETALTGKNSRRDRARSASNPVSCISRKDRGLFAKYGLVTEIIYIPGGTTNIQVLVSGSLDHVAVKRRAGCRRESRRARISFTSSGSSTS